jgi:hypothetical protein
MGELIRGHALEAGDFGRGHGDGKAIAAAGREEVERGPDKLEGKHIETSAANVTDNGGGVGVGDGKGTVSGRDPNAPQAPTTATPAQIQVPRKLGKRVQQTLADILRIRGRLPLATPREATFGQINTLTNKLEVAQRRAIGLPLPPMARAVNTTRMWSPGQPRVILTGNLARLRMSHGPERDGPGATAFWDGSPNGRTQRQASRRDRL